MGRKEIKGYAGFTLVELLVVMSIIAILATIAVPVFLGRRTEAMRAEAKSNLESLRVLEEQYYAEYGEYAPSAGDCANPVPANVDAIRGVLPGFKPGRGEDLYFNYCIEKDRDIDGNDTSAAADPYPCFRARAFGRPGVSVEGHRLDVDCNNEKNF